MLRDILEGQDAQLRAVLTVINALDADILLLQGFDYDFDQFALSTFNQNIVAPYEFLFSRLPNSGMQSGFDLNNDGEIRGAADAFGYADFAGQGGMAILSRYPILTAEVSDHSGLLWRDLPGANLPYKDGRPFPSETAHLQMRLSSVAHWVVPITLPSIGQVDLLVWHGNTPVFDGPQDLNGRRGGDETLFWVHYLDGTLGERSDLPVIVAGDANIDPSRGEGYHAAISRLMSHPDLQDPHQGSDTVNWVATGPMRVDYVLPDSRFTVVDAGVGLPAELVAQDVQNTASRHSVVWVDIALE